MEKISWNDRVNIITKKQEETNIVHRTKRRRSNRIGHTLRRNGIL